MFSFFYLFLQEPAREVLVPFLWPFFQIQDVRLQEQTLKRDNLFIKELCLPLM